MEKTKMSQLTLQMNSRLIKACSHPYTPVKQSAGIK